jgi:cytochrome c-type biogenesis protein
MTGLLADLSFAVGAGVATFLSPCALPLVPGYVGYYLTDAGDDRPLKGVAVRGLAAGAGVFVALAALAGLAITLGRPVTQVLPLVEPVVGAVLLGLGLLVVVGHAPSLQWALPARRASVAGFALFGLGFGGAAAGCVLPVFLGLVVHSLTLSVPAAATVVAVYASAVAVPLLVVTVAVGLGVDAGTGRIARCGGVLERTAGVVLVLAGAGQIVVALVPGAVPAV